MRRFAIMLALLSGGWLLTAGLAGCYRHVVRAEGPGAADMTIHEPNLPDDPAPNSSTTPTKKVPNQTVPTKKAP